MRLPVFIAAVLLAACSGEPAAQAPAQTTETAAPAVTEETKIAAVLSYADWCTSCKILDPKLKAVQAGAPIDGVGYLTIDYTERDQDAFFATADAAGVGGAVRAFYADEIKTGILLLVDMSTGDVVADIRKSMSEEEIRTSLETAAAA